MPIGPPDDPQFSIFEIDGLECVLSEAHAIRYPLHLHDAMEVLVIVEGSAGVGVMGEEVVLTTGEGAVLLPNEPHWGFPAPAQPTARFFSVQLSGARAAARLADMSK
ncbi:MAG: AraC family ligand binding domain-containing protein [Caulobacterales bacterium]|nr:AraC family ligand binding domain-containing protein [Caulobacterales bacterium]